MGKKGLIAVIAVIVVFATANVATAAVEFDPANGTGFVGKGDVQTLFAWNNAEFQENASPMFFTYIAVWTYTVVCAGSSGSQTVTAHGEEFGETVVRPRVNPTGKITGFELAGYSVFRATEAPEVGDSCSEHTVASGIIQSVSLNDDRADFLFAEPPNFGSEVIWMGS